MREEMPNIMFDAPVPGQSLTNSPEKAYPFERPPEYTNYEKAQEAVFDTLMDKTDEVIDLVSEGIPISLLATQVALTGFANGKWNADLMLLLIEPALYTIMFISEQAGIDYVLEFDEEFTNLPAESRLKAEDYLSNTVKQVVKDVESKTSSASIEDILPQSLLSRGEVTNGKL